MSSIFGLPVVIDNDNPALKTNGEIVLGDWSQYFAPVDPVKPLPSGTVVKVTGVWSDGVIGSRYYIVDDDGNLVREGGEYE